MRLYLSIHPTRRSVTLATLVFHGLSLQSHFIRCGCGAVDNPNGILQRTVLTRTRKCEWRIPFVADRKARYLGVSIKTPKDHKTPLSSSSATTTVKCASVINHSELGTLHLTHTRLPHPGETHHTHEDTSRETLAEALYMSVGRRTLQGFPQLGSKHQIF